MRSRASDKFKTDGFSIFLEIVSAEGDTKLLNIFSKQYTLQKIIERSLKDVEFQGAAPARWWPATRSKRIVIDPARSLGQPIDEASGVPTAALAAAVKAEGSIEAAARMWQVKTTTVRRALEFEEICRQRAA